MICACPCRKEFTPRRRNQIYRSPECKERARRQRSRIVRLSADEHRRITRSRIRQNRPVRRGNHPSTTHRALNPRTMPYEANLAFSKSAPAGNIKGALSRVALLSPRTMLRLGSSIREDAASGRPNWRSCEMDCADGEDCRKISKNEVELLTAQKSMR